MRSPDLRSPDLRSPETPTKDARRPTSFDPPVDVVLDGVEGVVGVSTRTHVIANVPVTGT